MHPVAVYGGDFGVSEMVMYFTQTPLSYVMLPQINDAYLSFDMEVSFRPETTDGKS